MLQYYLFYVFILCQEACGILAPLPGIEPAFPAPEGDVPITGLPGKLSCILYFTLYYQSKICMWLNHQTEGLRMKRRVCCSIFTTTSSLFRGKTLKILVSSPFGMPQQSFNLLIGVCAAFSMVSSDLLLKDEGLPPLHLPTSPSFFLFLTSPCFITIYNSSSRHLCNFIFIFYEVF